MSRIKIDFPEHWPFETEIAVRISDINYGGHLGNDSVLSLVHEARIQFLHSLGYSEKNIGGPGIIMTDAAIVFRSEGFYGDRLRIYVAVQNLSTAGFDMLYKMVRISDDREVARIKTGLVCYDYTAGKIAAMPETVRIKLLDVAK